MASPFLGQLKIVAFNFAPRGYALCNGQVLPIAQNTALFSLLGTTYGGNGTTNFALPNLQARVPVHFGTALNGDRVVLGQPGGEDSHTLSLAEMPAHNHELQGLAIAATSGG